MGVNADSTYIGFNLQVLSEERVIGIVTTELRSESGGEHQGRITYENRGECFFLPYGKEDVEGYVTLKPGDKVSFQIATNQRLEIVSCTFHFICITY